MFLLFHGTDEFSAHEAVAALRASPDFTLNVDVFAGATADLETIRQTCETLPFLSERRLVLVEGLPKRKRGAKSDGGESDDGEAPAQPESPKPLRAKKGKSAAGADPKIFAQGLADCAAKLPDTTTLAVLVDELLDPAHPLVQAARFGSVAVFTPPKGAQLETWIAKRATREGGSISREAARALAAEVGDDLRVLAQEVAKLTTYAGRDREIGVADVQALTPSSRQARVFDLTDALARRDRARALALLHELLAAGESPLGIVALTAFSTRSLLQVKTLAERGLRAPQIAQSAGMAPFIVDKSLALVRQFSFAQLEAAHRSLLDVDTALKSSRMTAEMALDLLVVEFGGVAR